MKKHLVIVSLMMTLSLLASCADKAQNQVAEGELVTEMRSAFDRAARQDKCSLILTPVVEKYIPLGTTKEDALQIIEKNGFKYNIGSRNKRLVRPDSISKDIPFDQNEKFEFISAYYTIPSAPFIFTKISFGLSVEFHNNQAIGLRSKVFCTSL